MKKDIAVIILAAGKGIRMKSDLPKVMHTISGKPMLGYVLSLSDKLNPKIQICVVGHKSELVREYIEKQSPKNKIVIQKKLLGSGDAVKQAKHLLKGFTGIVLVLYADNPLLKLETLKQLIQRHQRNKSSTTLLVANINKPSGYGRIFRDFTNNICRIIEEDQANEYEKDIKEVNTGVVCFDKEALFTALDKVKINRVKKEYYLTDVIQIIHENKFNIGFLKLEDFQEVIGINKQADLSVAEKIHQKRLITELMDKGVRIIDPDSTRICWDTRIQKGSVVFPFTVIERNVKIGKNCQIGPFCHIREDVTINDNAIIGNFTEISRSSIGAGTIAKHFCYLGDSLIGKKVNIGAGTVTANFDGKQKNLTKVEDESFIGSDTILVAPVKIGKHAATGAGSVVTRKHNVPSNATVIGVPARIVKKTNP